jgi:hypothetical protein
MNTREYLRQHMERIEALRRQVVRTPEVEIELEPIPVPAPKPAPTKLDYEKIVSDWWHSLVPATGTAPWSIETIAAAAFNGQPRPPALRFVAQALRQLGMVEKRDWTNAGRNRRLWYPPSNK